MPRKKAGTNKMEAMRQALAKLGKDAKSEDIHSFLKDNYKIDMSIKMIYNYKSAINRKAGKKRKGKKPGSKPATIAANGSRSTGISMADIQAVKALTDRIGAQKVADLAKVLA